MKSKLFLISLLFIIQTCAIFADTRKDLLVFHDTTLSQKLDTPQHGRL